MHSNEMLIDFFQKHKNRVKKQSNRFRKMQCKMKINGSRIALTLLVLVTYVSNGMCQSRKETKELLSSPFNYEVQLLGVGQDGSKVIKVWSYAKSVDEAILKCKKNGVAACLFRDIPPANGSDMVPAICGSESAYELHKEFFDSFFQTGGQYLRYITATTDDALDPQDRIKVKSGYKVGIAIQVLYDKLRIAMQSQKLAKSLTDGF